MKNFIIKTSEVTYKFYRVEANNIKEAEQIVFSSKDKINTLKTAQVIDSIHEEIIEPLTKQDLKEVSTNYLKSVIKNTDNEQLKNNCLQEIKERTTPTFFNGSEHIKL